MRAGQKGLHLGGGQGRAVERDVHAEVEQRLRAETGGRLSTDRGSSPAGGAARPPGRGHAYHDARVLQLRDIAEEAEGLRQRPAQRMEDLLAPFDHLLQPGAASRRALHRQEEREESLLIGRPRVLAERLVEGLLGLAVRREPARVRGEEGEGRPTFLRSRRD